MKSSGKNVTDNVKKSLLNQGQGVNENWGTKLVVFLASRTTMLGVYGFYSRPLGSQDLGIDNGCTAFCLWRMILVRV